MSSLNVSNLTSKEFLGLRFSLKLSLRGKNLVKQSNPCLSLMTLMGKDLWVKIVRVEIEDNPIKINLFLKATKLD